MGRPPERADQGRGQTGYDKDLDEASLAGLRFCDDKDPEGHKIQMSNRRITACL